jgi:hypothetical protein
MYSQGGLIQGSKSRAYTWLLRDYCLNWVHGDLPKEITFAKDFLQRELRDDLDVVTSGYDSSSLLSEEVENTVKNAVKANNSKTLSNHN